MTHVGFSREQCQVGRYTSKFMLTDDMLCISSSQPFVSSCYISRIFKGERRGAGCLMPKTFLKNFGGPAKGFVKDINILCANAPISFNSF